VEEKPNVEVRPSPADLEETFSRILGFRDELNALAKKIVTNGLSDVYFIGCGGSYLAGFPVTSLLQARTSNFAVHHLPSAEFTALEPKRLSSTSLVVAGSHTGGTPETLKAVEFAKSRGAKVIGFSYNPESALAKACENFFAYESKLTTGDAKQMMLAQIGWALLKAVGYEADYEAIDRFYENLGSALKAAHRGMESRMAELAAKYAAEEHTYILGSGPGFAAAYNLSMCYLQEMQWKHATYYNTAEFFHGGLEIVDKDTLVYLFKGEDSTRPIAERAERFLKAHTEKLVVFDSQEIELPGIPQEYRYLATPHVLLTVSIRLASHYAHETGHALSVRRYMGKVSY
jgi:fructoselysine-6-P-deglycase FrlB-like protein